MAAEESTRGRQTGRAERRQQPADPQHPPAASPSQLQPMARQRTRPEAQRAHEADKVACGTDDSGGGWRRGAEHRQQTAGPPQHHRPAAAQGSQQRQQHAPKKGSMMAMKHTRATSVAWEGGAGRQGRSACTTTVDRWAAQRYCSSRTASHPISQRTSEQASNRLTGGAPDDAEGDAPLAPVPLVAQQAFDGGKAGLGEDLVRGDLRSFIRGALCRVRG